MNSRFGTTTIAHAVTVAAGVYAPGHLGELTQYLPFEVVDDILEHTGTTQRRVRDLPSRIGVYILLALGLFPRLRIRPGVAEAERRTSGVGGGMPFGEGVA